MHIAAGESHSLAVSVQGHVYSWGLAANGRLGCSRARVAHCFREATQALLPMYVMGGVEQKKKKIVRVSAGDAHSMAIDDAGLLFAWGRNVEGQLGVGDEKSRMLPTIVPCPRMKTVAAGCIHTVAITLDGHGFSWGVDGGGRLGLIEEAGLVSTPRRCAAGDIKGAGSAALRLVDAAVGKAHSVFLAEKGSVWVFCGTGASPALANTAPGSTVLELESALGPDDPKPEGL